MIEKKTFAFALIMLMFLGLCCGFLSMQNYRLRTEVKSNNIFIASCIEKGITEENPVKMKFDWLFQSVKTAKLKEFEIKTPEVEKRTVSNYKDEIIAGKKEWLSRVLNKVEYTRCSPYTVSKIIDIFNETEWNGYINEEELKSFLSRVYVRCLYLQKTGDEPWVSTIKSLECVMENDYGISIVDVVASTKWPANGLCKPVIQDKKPASADRDVRWFFMNKLTEADKENVEYYKELRNLLLTVNLNQEQIRDTVNIIVKSNIPTNITTGEFNTLIEEVENKYRQRLWNLPDAWGYTYKMLIQARMDYNEVFALRCRGVKVFNKD